MDLGVLEGKVLLFGGPYSNLPATQAIQTKAERLGIAPSRVICTGDLVAYCAEPEAVVKAIQDWGVPVVMGNCEQSLAASTPDCGCGFKSNSTCALLSNIWYRFSEQHISDESRFWMAGLPREIRFQLAGRNILVVHGTPSSINRFIFASTPASEKMREMKNTDANIIVGGHSGIPFGQQIGKGFWLNSGVIGMPANDGSRTGWYLLLNPYENRIKVEWHRLEYDWNSAQLKMRQVGLSNGYADALETGLWPSMDVLPALERARQGLRFELMPLDVPVDKA